MNFVQTSVQDFGGFTTFGYDAADNQRANKLGVVFDSDPRQRKGQTQTVKG